MLRALSPSLKTGLVLFTLLVVTLLYRGEGATWWAVRGVFAAAMVGYLVWVDRRGQAPKTLTLRIEGVEVGDAGTFTQRLRSVFGEAVQLSLPSETRPGLAARIETRETLPMIIKRLRKAGLKMSLMQTEGRLVYTALAGQARVTVRVEGMASPRATVKVQGVDTPVTADAEGRFVVAVPMAVVRKHRRKGFIPATWSKAQVEQRIRVPIPA